jgi:hypothetical protein
VLEEPEPPLQALGLFRLVVLEEVAVLAAQVAPLCHIDGAESVARDAEEKKPHLGEEVWRGQGLLDPQA